MLGPRQVRQSSCCCLSSHQVHDQLAAPIHHRDLERRLISVQPSILLHCPCPFSGRALALFAQDTLLSIIVTTDSNHGRRIYTNRARDLVLTGINQLWIADLTYIRLAEEFVFLAAILDAFSRRVIGWALEPQAR
jgi:transposase InsO family protein